MTFDLCEQGHNGGPGNKKILIEISEFEKKLIRLAVITVLVMDRVHGGPLGTKI